jgi:FSR family fosmidomycin resistance protein-like MFS transporter
METTRQMLTRVRTFRLGVLALGHLIVDMYGGFFAPLIPVLVRTGRGRIAALTTLLAVAGVLINGIQPVAGLILHRFRAPYLLVIGPLLAAATPFLALAPSYGLLAAAILVGAVGTGMFHPEGLLAAHAVSGDDAHIGVPVFLSGGYFGYSLGALVATQWVVRFGLETMYVLAAPVVVLMVLYLLAGVTRAGDGRETQPEVTVDPRAPHFYVLMVLGALLASASVFLYSFMTIHLEAVMGARGLEVGGVVLFIIGSTSAFASFLWGYLTKRYSAFGLIALAQLACAPVAAVFLFATTAAGVIALSAVLGPLLGFFPIAASMARRARGLTPGLRSGLIIGGSWLLASLPLRPFGALIDRGVPVRTVLLSSVGAIAAAGLLSAGLYFRSRRVVAA